MTRETDNSPRLPTTDEIRRAVEIYLGHAYPSGVPEHTGRFLPDKDSLPGEWLMTDISEREIRKDAPSVVTSFALRVGNERYPNMKVRISMPPNGSEYLFCVDSHDGFLHAPRSSADYKLLEEMKAFNASVAQATLCDWGAAGLPTERNYMRRKIDDAKRRMSNDD